MEGKGYLSISLRNLQRLLSMQGSYYNAAQRNFIEYILKNVFPELIIKRNKLKYICNNWKNILFYDDSSKPQKIFLNTDFEKSLEGIFDEMARASLDEYEVIGDHLVEIFYCLKQYHRDGEFRNKNITNYIDISLHDNSIINSNESLEYDAKISTHILDFIRWIPLIPRDCENIQLLDTISNIIDTIRAQLFSSFYDIVNETLLATDSSINMFIGDTTSQHEHIEKLKNLRKLLINALYNDSFIKSLIESCYMKKDRI